MKWRPNTVLNKTNKINQLVQLYTMGLEVKDLRKNSIQTLK